MRKLKELSKKAPSGKQLQLMTIPFRPGFGYVIIDPGTEDSSMSAAPYIYEIDIIKDRRPRLREQPPMFYLSRKSTRAADQQWFDMFQEEFVQLWNCAAQSWPLDWVNGQLVDQIQLPSPCSEAGPEQAE
jgi:hypothetical protein